MVGMLDTVLHGLGSSLGQVRCVVLGNTLYSPSASLHPSGVYVAVDKFARVTLGWSSIHPMERRAGGSKNTQGPDAHLCHSLHTEEGDSPTPSSAECIQIIVRLIINLQVTNSVLNISISSYLNPTLFISSHVFTG